MFLDLRVKLMMFLSIQIKTLSKWDTFPMREPEDVELIYTILEIKVVNNSKIIVRDDPKEINMLRKLATYLFSFLKQ